MNFFAMDSFPIFYVTVETLAVTTQVEQRILTHIKTGEMRNLASYAGLRIAANVGGLKISLQPCAPILKRYPVRLDPLWWHSQVLPSMRLSF
ncbi:hypothetical protein PN36_29520 [Candidatus Thiomargarita nelsonii]|uniref:Uncharacterized protein n=1 Tax=Candidatus Thiomargarita nelsonii TaxID=1003181 RepID=A0A4E0QK59_9GAMM|nr:hypothetical protein PN36_29520 [Candidatus Thiomargarita nelsonii]